MQPTGPYLSVSVSDGRYAATSKAHGSHSAFTLPMLYARAIKTLAQAYADNPVSMTLDSTQFTSEVTKVEVK